jgi:hypothetical protein
MTEKNVAQAMAAVMAEVRAVGKNQKHDAPGAKFMFRGIDAVVDAVGPVLRNHGVIVVPQLVDVQRRDVRTSNDKPARETTVTVKYVFTGPDGSTLEAIVPGEAMDSGDKGTAKAMSVAFRIALLQALCLPTHDTDPDAEVYERGSMPIGHGQRPRNGQQPPAVNPADAARSALAKSCDDNGWDRDIVKNRFKAATGTDLRTATDADGIEEFRKSLFALSDGELRGAPATNGAAR